MAGRVLTQLATSVLGWGMRKSRFGPPEVVYKRSFVLPKEEAVSAATKRELEDGPGFFARFEGRLAVSDLEGLDVLDLGSGYGGRTLYYAVEGKARSVAGLEINPKMVELSRAAARAVAPGASVSFAHGRGEELPFEDESFDLILSYDVFEHVQDLAAVLAECRRTLRAGGRLCAIFPPYYGPRAHHLDFITTLPFLHHVFPSDALVEAANVIIARSPELERKPLKPVRRGETLPTLNGTTERRFRALVAASGLEAEELSLMPFAWGPGGAGKRTVCLACRAMLAAPMPFTRDVFGSSIRCILRKPGRA